MPVRNSIVMTNKNSKDYLLFVLAKAISDAEITRLTFYNYSSHVRLGRVKRNKAEEVFLFCDRSSSSFAQGDHFLSQRFKQAWWLAKLARMQKELTGLGFVPQRIELIVAAVLHPRRQSVLVKLLTCCCFDILRNEKKNVSRSVNDNSQVTERRGETRTQS